MADTEEHGVREEFALFAGMGKHRAFHMNAACVLFHVIHGGDILNSLNLIVTFYNKYLYSFLHL